MAHRPSEVSCFADYWYRAPQRALPCVSYLQHCAHIIPETPQCFHARRHIDESRCQNLESEDQGSQVCFAIRHSMSVSDNSDRTRGTVQLLMS